jgi:hypothetical protein
MGLETHRNELSSGFGSLGTESSSNGNSDTRIPQQVSFEEARESLVTCLKMKEKMRLNTQARLKRVKMNFQVGSHFLETKLSRNGHPAIFALKLIGKISSYRQSFPFILKEHKRKISEYFANKLTSCSF